MSSIKLTPYEKRLMEYVAKRFGIDPSDKKGIELKINSEAFKLIE